jgi:hypothetical protein
MQKIKLKNSDKVVLVDDSDVQSLSAYDWYISNSGYAYTRWKFAPIMLMHCYIIGQKDGLVIDHINRDRLDNRRLNLRHITQRKNCLNRGTPSNNKIGLKGVHMKKNTGRYCSQIYYNGVKEHLGYFDTAEEAKTVYDRRWIELFEMK